LAAVGARVGGRYAEMEQFEPARTNLANLLQPGLDLVEAERSALFAIEPRRDESEPRRAKKRAPSHRRLQHLTRCPFNLIRSTQPGESGAIAPKLKQTESERAKRKPTESRGSYDCYLRGMASVHHLTRETTVVNSQFTVSYRR
jgi:hypothetical protein